VIQVEDDAMQRTRCDAGRNRANWLVVAAVIAAAPTPTHAECARPCLVDRARDKLAHGDAVGARTELQAAYRLDPAPELLFALGQVELKLGNYAAAIDYYERFIAANPGDEQVALAQQAIGAARMELARPVEPTPVPPRVGHRWSTENTGLIVLGGASIVVGAGLLWGAQRLGNDRSGSLAAYDDRLDQARALRLTGAGVATVGVLAIGAAFVRWRLATFEVRAEPVTGGGAVSVARRW
jgi:tetratricopeptide (TPR) repeat protein